MSEALVLCDVGPPYEAAFEEVARAEALRLVRFRDAPAQPVREFSPALLVVHMGPGRESLERAAGARKLLREAPAVFLIEEGAVENAFHAGRLGAQDLIVLPEEPERVVRRALCASRRGADETPAGLRGVSIAAASLRRNVTAAAATASTVLLTGETGSGKGHIARTLHGLSERREHAFVHVDCAALSPTVIESELFGHERGAFTGAVGRRPGRLEMAAEGTLFLDEIAELDPGLQAKFLRALEDRIFERVGGTTGIRLRARVIAATNRNLRHEVKKGRFREDLYYRLRVVQIRIPPLRSRLADIPGLVRDGVASICDRLEIPQPEVDKEFSACLMHHNWAGNVRELMNFLEGVLVHARPARLTGADAELALRALREPDEEEPELDALADATTSPEVEYAILARALQETGGNLARAARRLGVPRSTLRYRIRRRGLTHLIPRD